MPIRKIEFVNGEIYHIIMRGAGGQTIFLRKDDCFRFIDCLSLFNRNDLTPSYYRVGLLRGSVTRPGLVTGVSTGTQEKLVKLLGYALVKNHFHLILKQIGENGVRRFMQKLGTGFAVYINRKYERVGHLFQGRFRAVHVRDDDQARHIFVYVHTNSLELIEPGWREKGIKNKKKAIEFLENSFLTSYPQYLDRRKKSSLIDKCFFLDLLGGTNGCRQFVENWISFKAEIESFENINLERG